MFATLNLLCHLPFLIQSSCLLTPTKAASWGLMFSFYPCTHSTRVFLLQNWLRTASISSPFHWWFDKETYKCSSCVNRSKKNVVSRCQKGGLNNLKFFLFKIVLRNGLDSFLNEPIHILMPKGNCQWCHFGIITNKIKTQAAVSRTFCKNTNQASSLMGETQGPFLSLEENRNILSIFIWLWNIAKLCLSKWDAFKPKRGKKWGLKKQ